MNITKENAKSCTQIGFCLKTYSEPKNCPYSYALANIGDGCVTLYENCQRFRDEFDFLFKTTNIKYEYVILTDYIKNHTIENA